MNTFDSIAIEIVAVTFAVWTNLLKLVDLFHQSEREKRKKFHMLIFIHVTILKMLSNNVALSCAWDAWGLTYFQRFYIDMAISVDQNSLMLINWHLCIYVASGRIFWPFWDFFANANSHNETQLHYNAYRANLKGSINGFWFRLHPDGHFQ